LGSGLGAVVLLVSAVGNALEHEAAAVFVLALAILTADAAALFWLRRFAYGVVTAAVLATLLQFSLMKWYGPHWAPGSLEGHNHRHTIWELGHVH
jgi:uncharacterized membrane protein YdjX (TVP38/TMEM64 family)